MVRWDPSVRYWNLDGTQGQAQVKLSLLRLLFLWKIDFWLAFAQEGHRTLMKVIICIFLWRELNMWTQIWALACPSQHVTWESQVYMRKTQELSPTREQRSGTGILRYRLNAVRRLFSVFTRGTSVSVSALRTDYTQFKSVLFTQSTFTNTTL